MKGLDRVLDRPPLLIACRSIGPPDQFQPLLARSLKGVVETLFVCGEPHPGNAGYVDDEELRSTFRRHGNGVAPLLQRSVQQACAKLKWPNTRER